MRLKRTLPALLLCLALVLCGPARPFSAYSSFEADFDPDEVTHEDFESDFEPEDDEGAQNVDPGTSSSRSRSSNANSIEARYAGELEDLGEKLDQLKAESEKLNASINNAKTEKERAQAEKNAIDYQITLTRDQIDAYEQRIELLLKNIDAKQASINLKEQDIEKKQAEINNSYETLRKRLRAKYMQSSVSTLGLVLGAENFSDLLTRMEYTRRIAEHDKAFLANLAEQRAGLEEERRGLVIDMEILEDIRLDVESDKVESEKQKEVLGVQVAKAALQVQDLAELERQFRENFEENQKKQQQMQAEIERIIREIEWSKNAYAGGKMAWPVPAYVPGGKLNVTSEFGPRFSNTDYHTGIDFSGTGIHGADVVAANDGKVVVAENTYIPGYSYGKYVMLDHGVDENGNSISTIYAHLYGLAVSVGQEVKRGDVVGYVGSTGWSTGPHLHFEVRVGGKAVNPRPYVFA